MAFLKPSTLVKSIKTESNKFFGLPVGEKGFRDNSFYGFLENLYQYLSVNPYSGLLTKLPREILMFYRDVPKNPTYGKGFAKTYVGTILANPMPYVKIGDPYYYVKPPAVAVIEEVIKKTMSLQASSFLEVLQWQDKYLNIPVHGKITQMAVTQNNAAINRAIMELFTYYMLSLGRKTDDIPYVLLAHFKMPFLLGKDGDAGDDYKGEYSEKNFDQMELYGREPHHLPDADPTATAENVKNTGKFERKEFESKTYLTKYQHESVVRFKQIQKEACKLKNINYYDPNLTSEWLTKDENKVEIKANEAPEANKTIKDLIEKRYLNGQKKTPPLTRSQTVHGVLTHMANEIALLTDPGCADWRNHVSYDPTKNEIDFESLGLDKAKADALKEKYQLFITHCPREECIIIVSAWDYDDFVAGGTPAGALGGSRVTLSAVAGDIPVIKSWAFEPGRFYIGSRYIINFFMVLNNNHFEYMKNCEDKLWIANYMFIYGTYGLIPGKMYEPGKNKYYRASAYFYNKFCPEIAAG